MLSEIFSWERSSAALYRTRDVKESAILLDVTYQFFIGHLNLMRVAFQRRTALEDSLVQILPQYAIQRTDGEEFLAEWAFIRSFTLPFSDTANAKHLVAVVALHGVKYEHQANVALKVLWALPLYIRGLRN